MKKPRPDADTLHPKEWSIGSNGLTSHGQTELLKQLGERMKPAYRELVDEPLPADLSVLLERLRGLTRGSTGHES